ncbi:MAG: homoserine O-acetyltransferase [Clostridia bacterium]|nr:homoserine O-acetyltransferase [Clostridia bacterium]
MHVQRVAGPGEFALESGARLGPVDIAYQTWGAYDPHAHGGAGNAVLVCHALTGDSDAPGWWAGVVGPGGALDPDRHFIICSNVLGGCRGSTGPGSPAEGGRPYGLRFPVITVGDMVRAQARLLDALGVERLALVVGGSLGGMQALAWALLFPDRIGGAVVMAAPWATSPMSIAWNEVGRQAILLDPDFAGGDYPPGDGPARGLAIARMLAMTTYRSGESFWLRHGRAEVPPGADPVAERLGAYATQASAGRPSGLRFQIESYLHYQGEKLVRRFDANTYLYLTRAMDLFDADRYAAQGAERRAAAAERGRLPSVLAVGIDSDILYTAAEVREVQARLRLLGYPAEYREIRSPHGHDAFLIETEQAAAAIAEGLERALSGAPLAHPGYRGNAWGV